MTPHEITELARAKFGEPNQRLSTDCELRFGHKGSVSVVLTGEKAGSWFDHEQISGGHLSPSSSGQQQYQRPQRRNVLKYGTDSSDRCARLVEQSRAVRPGSPADLYLRSRGADRWPSESIRETISGVLYVARDVNGAYLAAQLVPLTQDGRKNPQYWSDGVTKRTYTMADGWMTFAACRMPGRGRPVLCEGVETALSVWLATGRPTYGCLGQAGLRHLRVGTRLTIARDGDDPDSQASASIARTIQIRREQGQLVRLATPPVGKDFNDIHLEQGLKVVAQYINEAPVQR